MNKIYLLFLIPITLFVQCKPEDGCPPNSKISLTVKDSFKEYFPYKPNKKVVFEKYNDTTIVGDIDFLIDTFSFIKHKKYSFECKDGRSIGQYFRDEYSEHFIIKLINQTELGKDLTLEFEGKYRNTDYDPTSLLIRLYNYNNSIYDFENTIVKGNSSNWIDNFMILGKNYGKVYCLSPSWKNRIYLNKQYGIIAYLDDSNKMKLIIK